MKKPKLVRQPTPAEQAAAMHRLKDQMLIVLMKRLAIDNKFKVLISEVDDTDQDMLTIEATPDQKSLIFTISKKS